MRILVAVDAFGGALSAVQAAQAVADGWRRHAPGDALELCPMSGGGPGLVDVLCRLPHARLVAVPPPGGSRPAAVAVLGGTAVVEAAQACGEARPGPGAVLAASSRPLAGLLLAARAQGVRRVVVGLGGTTVLDGGAGLLLGLAEHLGLADDALRARLGRGVAGLAGCTAAELAVLADVRRDWEQVDLVGAHEQDLPLLGLHGLAASEAEDLGASAEQAQQAERALGDLAAAVEALPPARPALPLAGAGRPRRLSATPGAGAGGGTGLALLALGGRLQPGAALVWEEVAGPGRLARQDLVVTGEESFGWRSLRGGTVATVGAAGLELGVPVVVLAGQVEVGRREALALGVESAYPVARNPAEAAAAAADPAGALAARAERVARTWSRPAGGAGGGS